MNAVATSSSNSLCKRHRNSSEEDSDSGLIKKPRYFYVLEPETTDYSDGSESVYSIQLRTTDTAKDTSDTSTKSEESVEEYEVVSNSGDPIHPFPMRDSSSPPEDIIVTDAIISEIDTKSDVDSACEANDSSSVETEKRRDYAYKRLFLFKMCAHCGQKNDIPLFRCCKKCYKVRKNFFPPRPRRRKRKTENKASVSKDGIKSPSDSGLNSALSLSEKALVVDNSDQDSNRKELCGTCLMEPKDGGYVHKNIVHCYSCYRCSVKTVKQIGRCPICNLRVRQICRVITI